MSDQSVFVPRRWGTLERRSRRLEGKQGSLLKGVKSVSTLPPTPHIRSLLLLCSRSNRRGGKSEEESLDVSTSFSPLKILVIVHKLWSSPMDGWSICWCTDYG